MCCLHCRSRSASLLTTLNSHSHPQPSHHTHLDSRSVITKPASGSFLGDLLHNVSPSGSVFVGRFYYRKHTKWDCFSPCSFDCVCVCLDDILIFVNFRLEATLSHSPMVKGKNKRNTCPVARSRAHVHRAWAILLDGELSKLSGPFLMLFPFLTAIKSWADWSRFSFTGLRVCRLDFPRMKPIDCQINY